jgi:UDP-2-acetamido-2-deoxy-ribo-hexuluronate aminotransferase
MQFIDLQEQYALYKDEIRAEMAKVLDTGRFILGPAVSELEGELAAFTGVKHAIGCSSGTDALLIALMALELKPGEEVITPDFTFFATMEAVSFLGGVPVFVDIQPDTCNIDPGRIEAKISSKTRGIIAVSLYGQCADFDELSLIARRHKLFLVEDAAQSFGATYKGRKSGSLCELATTSFYPAKPLGAYGDAGALFTNDDTQAERIRNLLNHGQVSNYRHRYVGLNGRLDSLQAAILKVKLRHFPEELELRQQVASWYDAELSGMVQVPCIRGGNRSSWAQYTVRSPQRARIQEHLKQRGIPTAIHYPMPVHQQEAYASLRIEDNELAESIRASREVISLPMHPFLSRQEVSTVAAAIQESPQ